MAFCSHKLICLSECPFFARLSWAFFLLHSFRLSGALIAGLFQSCTRELMKQIILQAYCIIPQDLLSSPVDPTHFILMPFSFIFDQERKISQMNKTPKGRCSPS
jgi:hypothetical protein